MHEAKALLASPSIMLHFEMQVGTMEHIWNVLCKHGMGGYSRDSLLCAPQTMQPIPPLQPRPNVNVEGDMFAMLAGCTLTKLSLELFYLWTILG